MRVIAEELKIDILTVRGYAKQCYDKSGQDNAVCFVLYVLSRPEVLAEVFDVR